MLIKRTTAICFGLVYLYFAGLQYNDPDPAVWMTVYGIAAILCFMVAAGKITSVVLWSVAILYTAGGLYMWPERFEGVSIGGGDIKNIEEAREALGLLLCALTFAGFSLLNRYELRRNIRLQQLQKTKWANL